MTRSFRLTPPPLDGMLERPRLLHRLRRRFDVPITTVVAGAGFGKSVLLAQAMRDNTLNPRGTDLWLSCDAGDAVPTNLMAGLAAAAGLDPRRSSDPRGFLSAIAEQWPTGVCVIVDDLQEVPDGSPGLERLTAMATDAPPGVTFVLSSRTAPSGLARLRAQGRVDTIGEDDLAYRTDEVAKVAGSGPADLGGWPALVSLASSFGVAAAREFVTEEHISAVDPTTRRALATLALIGGADPEVAAVALGQRIDLDELLTLPLVTTHGDRVVPHAIWRELLADELDPDERRIILGRLGGALLDRGDEVRAGAVFITADDLEGLRSAVRAACARGYATTPSDVLVTWWEVLGRADRHSPEAMLLSALVRRTTEPFSDETRAALTDALASAREAGDVRLEIAALWEFGFVARARGELEDLLAEIPRVLALEAGGEELAVPLATIARVVVSDAVGDQEAAKRSLASLDRSTVSTGWQAPVDFLRMVFAFSDGDLPGISAAAYDYLDCLPGDYPGRAFVEPWVDWLRGIGPADWDAVPVPGTFVGSTAADRLWSGISVGLMLAYTGRVEQATVAVDVAVEAARTARLPYLQATVAAARAALAVSRGDEVEARSILEAEAGDDPDALHVRQRGLRHTLPVGYVLLPALRRHWDESDLGPLHLHARTLARAVLDARTGEAAKPLDDADLDHLATMLPLSWAVAVTCAQVELDPVRAREMVERLAGVHGERTRDALRAAAELGARSAAKAATALLGSVPVGSVGVAIHVLGNAELIVGGRVAEGPEWRRGRVRALLCLLADRRRIRREEAMDLLWPDLEADAARHNLRVTLNYLQRLIEPGRRSGEAPFYLRQDSDWLWLLEEPHVVVDRDEFEHLIARGDSARAEGQLAVAADAFEEAFARWRGGYLLDVVNDEWAQASVARVSSRAAIARISYASIRLALGDATAAVGEALLALEIDPWSEPAFRLLVAGHLGRGDRAAAKRALQQCLAMLEELGVSPSAETDLLGRRLDLPDRRSGADVPLRSG